MSTYSFKISFSSKLSIIYQISDSHFVTCKSSYNFRTRLISCRSLFSFLFPILGYRQKNTQSHTRLTTKQKIILLLTQNNHSTSRVCVCVLVTNHTYIPYITYIPHL